MQLCKLPFRPSSTKSSSLQVLLSAKSEKWEKTSLQRYLVSRPLTSYSGADPREGHAPLFNRSNF